MAIAAASADGKDVFGKNGLFDELKKALAERMLARRHCDIAAHDREIGMAFAEG
jgi:hypothetical protein